MCRGLDSFFYPSLRFQVTYADLTKAVDSLARAITAIEGSKMSLAQVRPLEVSASGTRLIATALGEIPVAAGVVFSFQTAGQNLCICITIIS